MRVRKEQSIIGVTGFLSKYNMWMDVTINDDSSAENEPFGKVELPAQLIHQRKYESTGRNITFFLNYGNTSPALQVTFLSYQQSK